LDAMFESQPHWASHHNPQPQLVWRHLEKVELDLDQLRRDMNDPEIAKRVEQDIADANTLNVRKTPGFFVNGKPLVTFGSEQLKAMLEEEIRLQYPGF
ncbi:MAG: DsbA family protein, partial [Mariprofundaceae bacterium]